MGSSKLGIRPRVRIAPQMMHYVVDELHSTENKEDIVLSQALDDFRKRSKFTLVL